MRNANPNHQTPNPNVRARLGAWCFSGVWVLVLGVFLQMNLAHKFIAAKVPLPSALSSAEQRAAFDRLLWDQSITSARTTSADYLARVQDALLRIMEGESESQMRADLQIYLRSVGYTPEQHFGTTADAEIPPATEGELRDLSSDKRIKFVLDTNYDIAAGKGQQMAGLEPDALQQYPAWELVRDYTRLKPRDEFSPIPWAERFVRAGGTLLAGRMVALKTDAVWSNLGNSGLFSDGLDGSSPPYAFNSGMGWEEVSRADCLALGLDLDEQSAAHPVTRAPGENIVPREIADAALAELKRRVAA